VVPIKAFGTIAAIRWDVMARLPPIAKMMMPAVKLISLRIAGQFLVQGVIVPPRLHHHRPPLVIAILANAFMPLNALIFLLNVRLIPLARPCA
jgi:hypothetical protein